MSNKNETLFRDYTPIRGQIAKIDQVSDNVSPEGLP